MCEGIKKKKERRQCSTGVQKTGTQNLSTNNGTCECVGTHSCGLEDYLSKWTYCDVGNELKPPFLLPLLPGWSGCHWHRQQG